MLYFLSKGSCYIKILRSLNVLTPELLFFWELTEDVEFTFEWAIPVEDWNSAAQTLVVSFCFVYCPCKLNFVCCSDAMRHVLDLVKFSSFFVNWTSFLGWLVMFFLFAAFSWNYLMKILWKLSLVEMLCSQSILRWKVNLSFSLSTSEAAFCP